MLEIIAITVSIIAGIGTLGHTGYKIYKTYKQKEIPTVVINEDHHISIVDELIIDALKNKKNKDDDIEVKINIHTHDTTKKIHDHKD